ncbi:pyruvate kinase [candidate division KSB1 bacterium]
MNKIRKTKIICTIGPAVNDDRSVKMLINKGMDAARLNMSHGSYDSHKKSIKRIREISKKLDRNIAIIADIQGPKIRLGDLKNFETLLEEGKKFKIVKHKIIGDETCAFLNNKEAFLSIKSGDRLFLNDGIICLEAVEKSDDKIICKVKNSGVIRSRTGVNLPDTDIDFPVLTVKDVNDIKFAVEQKLDYIALSFITKKHDIEDAKKIIKEFGADIPVIAKIEKPGAVEDIDNIIDVSDAVMVARGDLGIEISPEKVPVVQKQIVKKCIQKGKPVIVATQILDSMIRNPVPTRAEASDAANAVFDSADCLMLSGETAIGKYPEKALEMLDKLIVTCETQYPQKFSTTPELSDSIPDAVAYAAYSISEKIDAKYIACISHTGNIAKGISRYRPNSGIVAISDNNNVLNRLSIVKSVIPLKIDKIKNTDLFFELVEKKIESVPDVKIGDIIVLTAGIPTLEKGSTNALQIFRIEKRKKSRVF